MSTSLNLTYFKIVLSKVCAYPPLLKKELEKAKNHLSSYDYYKLKVWLSKQETSSLTLD